jgi:hypothetical protein
MGDSSSVGVGGADKGKYSLPPKKNLEENVKNLKKP